MGNGEVYPNVAIGKLIEDSLQIITKIIEELQLSHTINIAIASAVEIGEERESKAGQFAGLRFIIVQH